mmetsp:Transcript_17165/g.20809  ORF Transcript_17165/g.20809 Transcript_17165/m.20809 type:complete len:591 (-) Transcript_17165:862-2634(-)
MSPANSSTSPVKLFVGGLSYDTTDASLSRYFEQYGQLESAVVLRDPETLRSRGFGFVTFTRKEDADEALDCKRHMVDGRKVETKLAVPRSASGSTGKHASSSTGKHSSSNKANGRSGFNSNSSNKVVNSLGASSGVSASASNTASAPGSSSSVSNSKNTSSGSRERKKKGDKHVGGLKKQDRDKNSLVPNKIFVGGLLYATGHDSLRRYFEEYGEVETAEVIYNKDTKKSRGFGFVVFGDFDAVTAVLETQDRKSRHVIDGKQVEVKLCKARQESSPSSIAKLNPVENTVSPVTSAAADSISKAKQKVAPPPTVNQWHQKSLITSFAQAVAVGTEHEKSDAKVSEPIVQEEYRQPDVSLGQAVTVVEENDSVPVLSQTFQNDPIVSQGDIVSEITQTVESQPPFVGDFLTSSPTTNNLENTQDLPVSPVLGFSETIGYVGATEANPIASRSESDNPWKYAGTGTRKDSLGYDIGVNTSSLFAATDADGPVSPLASFLSPRSSSYASTPSFPQEHPVMHNTYMDQFSLPPPSYAQQGSQYVQPEPVDNLFAQQGYQGFSMFGVPDHHHLPQGQLHVNRNAQGSNTARNETQ